MIDLTDPQIRLELAETVRMDIDDACEALYESGHRKHLGASSLGDSCSRKLWYQFRWAKKGFRVGEDDHPGRMLRLWQRGTEQEQNIHIWLKQAGYTVEPVDPSTGEQWRFSDVSGHVGGSCDGQVWLPEKFEYPEPLLLEVKTVKGGASFNNYFKNGVKFENDKYYVQMCLYGYKLNLNHCLFLSVCKDNDKIYSEIVELNPEVAKFALERANEIVNSPIVPGPERISMHPSKFECKYCNYQQICHYGEDKEVDRNCRSCVHSQPAVDGQWFCNHYGNTIPEDFIPTGCDSHEAIL